MDEQRNKDEIRCTKCDKLFAKILSPNRFEIKCVRCGTFNVIFNHMIEQIIVADPEAKVLYINDAAEKATGYRNVEVVGQKISELWGNHMSPEFYIQMWRTIKEQKKVFKAILKNKKKTGEFYENELIISPILNTEGMIIFYIAVEVVLKKDV